jgi:hypothetical protein
MQVGDVNAWFCPECRALTFVRHADVGTTPMFLRCRAIPDSGCQGEAHSLMYPGGGFMAFLGVVGFAPKEFAKVEVQWEWYAANIKQRANQECLSLRRVAA